MNSREIDISGLNDFKIQTKKDWNNWTLNGQQFENISVGYTNKFNFFKNIKYCDVNQIQVNGQDQDYHIVQDYVRKKQKDFISKNNRMNQNRQQGNPFKRIYNKKAQRNQKHWATYQFKTNFKKITVKNNWKQVKTINKNTLQNIPQIKDLTIQTIKTFGNLHYLNPSVDKISWQQIKFKQNSSYTVDPLSSISDPYLTQIAGQLMQSEQNTDRINVICHPTFLLALLTTKASVYPWNISVQKDSNIIVLQNYKNIEDQSQSLNYLDLFTVNQNTTNNMPAQQSKLKQTCITATKMTKIFKDLLASGQIIQKQLIQQHLTNQQQQQPQNQQEQQDQQEQDEFKQLKNSDRLRKYIKVSFGKYDIYTYVEVDGAKINNTTGQLQYYLIRSFVQSQTQGKWVQNMKTPGAMMTQQYHSNSCSIQKWICQAKLAGVDQIKTGFIAFDHNKSPLLLSVQANTVKSFQNTLSFKYDSCWTNVSYLLQLLEDVQDGNYVISKDPYSPLVVKVFQTVNAQEDEQDDEQEQEQENKQEQK